MLSLSSLAGWEEAVLASIAGATGTPLERDSQIERSGLYGEYPAIVNAYLELFSDPESRLEALKRAFFLVWRSAMAVPTESGIAPLPDGTTRVVVDELDAWARRDGSDAELLGMLGWYHAASPSLLELFGASRQLVRLAESAGPERWRAVGITPSAMGRRGQMGRYWAELASGAR